MAKKIKKNSPANSVRVTPISTRNELPITASNLDVDQVASILRQSEQGNSTLFWRLCRTVVLQDAHIQSELFKRKNAVLGDPLTVTPWDKNNPADVEAATAVELMLLNSPDIFNINAHLLDATLYPLSIAEKVFATADPSAPELGRRFSIAELVPVPYRLIGWDQDGNPIVTDKEQFAGFQSAPPIDTSRYIIHRGHMLSAPDRFGGPMRSIFFLWLLSAMATTWWARYLERYGSPFIVGRVDGSDDNDRRILESAIAYSTQLGGLVVSNVSQVELKESAKDSGAGFESFKAHCRREISRLILGQTLSSEASPTGLGSGTADLQGDVRSDIRRFDARCLGETLRNQLVTQWLDLNGYTGRPPTITFAEDTTEEVKRTADLLQSLAAAGIEPTDDALTPLSERLGFPIQRKAAAPAYSPFAAEGVGDSRAFFRRERF